MSTWTSIAKYLQFTARRTTSVGNAAFYRRAAARRRLSIESLEHRALLTAAMGDFDGDGFDDLVVGVPGEDVGTIPDAGAVTIIYGSDFGLSTAWLPKATWHKDSSDADADMVGVPEAYDRFGYAVAVGNFNGDDYDDLAIGVPYQDVNGNVDAGAIHIMYGSAAGLTPSAGPSANGNAVIHQDSSGVVGGGGAEPGDRFGFSLAVGRFNGDDIDDLAVGAPGETVDGKTFAGGAMVFYGGESFGLTGGGSVFLSQDSLEDSPSAGDNFGFSMVVGRFNDDAVDDLAISAPFEDVDNEDDKIIDDAGLVHVLYGPISGGVPDNEIWHQGLMEDPDDDESETINGALESGDAFGYSLAAGNFGSISADGGSAIDDLAVGVPFEDVGDDTDAGYVHVIYGGSTGLAFEDNASWSQLDITGLFETELAKDQFGFALAAGRFNDDLFADLAIGAPFEEDLSLTGNDGGVVHVLYGAAAGIDATGSAIVKQETASGLPGTILLLDGDSEMGDAVGYSLTVGNFDGVGHDDLAIGAPGDDDSGTTDAGAVYVLYSDDTGLAQDGDQIWYQSDLAGEGEAESSDGFGCSLGGGNHGHVCLTTFETHGFSLPTYGPQPVDNSTLTEAQMERMRDYVQSQYDGNVMGYQFAVRSGDTTVEYAGGMATNAVGVHDIVEDVTDGDAMTMAMQLNLGSVSKMITSATILKLASLPIDDPRHVDLRSPFHQYINSQRFPVEAIHPSVRPVTILELLTHTASLAFGRRAVSAEVAKGSGLGNFELPRRIQQCFDPADTGSPNPPEVCLRTYENSHIGTLRLVTEGVLGTDVAAEQQLEDDGTDIETLSVDELSLAHENAYVSALRDLWMTDAGIDAMKCNSGDLDDPGAYDTDYFDVNAEGEFVKGDLGYEGLAKGYSCGAGGWRATSAEMLQFLETLRDDLEDSPLFDEDDADLLGLLLDTTLSDASGPGGTALSWEPAWNSPTAQGDFLGKGGDIPGEVHTYVTRLLGDTDAVLFINSDYGVDDTIKSAKPVTVLRDAFNHRDPDVVVLGSDQDDTITIDVYENADLPNVVDYLLVTMSGGTSQNFTLRPDLLDSIVFDLGTGQDTVTIVGTTSANIPIRLIGGDATSHVDVDFTNLVTGLTLDASGYLGTSEILAGGGDDNIWASQGNSTVEGRDGEDTIHGGASNDEIHGGQFDDLIYGEGGSDRIIGGNGSDTLDGGSGEDWIIGGNEMTTWGEGTPDNSSDVIYGGPDNDRIIGDNGSLVPLFLDSSTGAGDTIDGGGGNDMIYGVAGPDVIHGNSGDDTIVGGFGQDELYGDDGVDVIVGGSVAPDSLDDYADFIDGGGDDDQLFGDNVEVIPFTGGMAFSPVYGAGGNDSILGGKGSDEIYGQDGSDRIQGNDGSDLIFAGTGRDVAIGGSIICDTHEPPDLPGDVNGDGRVNVSDVAVLARNFGLRSGAERTQGDMNGDGVIGLVDLVFVQANFGKVRDTTRVSAPSAAGRRVDGTPLPGCFDDYREPRGPWTDPIIDVGVNIESASDGSDRIYGDDGADVLIGDNYSPQWGISALGGAGDFIYGGIDRDLIFGQIGADELYGEIGPDVLVGGEAGDTIDGGVDDDELYGGAGDDTLRGQQGSDTLIGEAGSDQLLGGANGDLIVGDHFAPLVPLADYADDIDGGDGNDAIFGDTLASYSPLVFSSTDGQGDTIAGSGGNDQIFGQGGIDVINGGDDEDIIFGGQGSDVLRGGSQGDEIYGEDGNDTIDGDDDDDLLVGGSGIDVIHGGLGADTIIGGQQTAAQWAIDSSDELFGDDGNDTIFGDNVDATTMDPVAGGSGDVIRGGDGNDTIYGQDGRDEIYGENDADFISGGDDADRLGGGDGDDILEGDDGDDFLNGGLDDDLLRGGIGDDTLAGDLGHDILVGDSGGDELYGSRGNDILIGGIGADSLFGEEDDDLLINGRSAYDTQDIALRAILAEWTDATSYEKRVSTLKDPAFFYYLAHNATAFDDLEQDTMTGGVGEDWFFADPLQDIIDLIAGEVVN